MQFDRLKKRSEFVNAARSGMFARMPSVIVQMVRAADQNHSDLRLRVGFTASRRVGSAVIRNRCKRRLRAAANSIDLCNLPFLCDIVLIAVSATNHVDFAVLKHHIKIGIDKCLALLMKSESAPI